MELVVLHNDRDPRQLIDGSIAPVMTAAWRGPTAEESCLWGTLTVSHTCTPSMPMMASRRPSPEADACTQTLRSMARNATRWVVVATPHSSGDLLLIDMATSSERRLTSLNHEFFEAHPPATMEKFSLPRGGQDIESRVLLPPDFDPSGRYPLILDIPRRAAGEVLDAFDLDQQVIATAGYIVLAVNPRGSSSYGPDFAKAVLRDWGGEGYLDIMAAVDETCSRPYVDESPAGRARYSYGGVHERLDSRARQQVWRGRGRRSVHQPMEYVRYLRHRRQLWGGPVGRSARGRLRRPGRALASDVRARCRDPGAPHARRGRLRCPIGQSEEYFVALKRLDKEVEFVRFPGSNHGFLRAGHPRMRQEYLNQMLAWFDKHLRAKSPDHAGRADRLGRRLARYLIEVVVPPSSRYVFRAPMRHRGEEPGAGPYNSNWPAHPALDSSWSFKGRTRQNRPCRLSPTP